MYILVSETTDAVKDLDDFNRDTTEQRVTNCQNKFRNSRKLFIKKKKKRKRSLNICNRLSPTQCCGV